MKYGCGHSGLIIGQLSCQRLTDLEKANLLVKHWTKRLSLSAVLVFLCVTYSWQKQVYEK